MCILTHVHFSSLIAETKTTDASGRKQMCLRGSFLGSMTRDYSRLYIKNSPNSSLPAPRPHPISFHRAHSPSPVVLPICVASLPYFLFQTHATKHHEKKNAAAAAQEEFPTLCEALASRLETEAGDRKSANLCYM